MLKSDYTHNLKTGCATFGSHGDHQSFALIGNESFKMLLWSFGHSSLQICFKSNIVAVFQTQTAYLGSWHNISSTDFNIVMQDP